MDEFQCWRLDTNFPQVNAPGIHPAVEVVLRVQSENVTLLTLRANDPVFLWYHSHQTPTFSSLRIFMVGGYNAELFGTRSLRSLRDWPAFGASKMATVKPSAQQLVHAPQITGGSGSRRVPQAQYTLLSL